MKKKILLNRIFITSLPFLCIIMANLFSCAHFKSFCLIKLITSHPCLGCGLTRALAAVSRFEFKEAYDLNPLIYIIIPILIFAWIMLLKNAYKETL